MTLPNSLRHRILTAFFALAFVVCSLFAAGFFWALDYAELVLFDRRVESDIRTFISQYKVDPVILTLPRENFEVFAARDGATDSLPSYLLDLGPEGDEVIRDGREFHIDVRQDGDTTFYFLFDETTYEEFDQLAGIIVPAMIAVICGIAVALGFALSNRIIRPLTNLAERVNRFEPPVIPADEQSSGAGDEIQVLARAVESFQGRVQELLTREREFSSDVSHELRTPLMGIQAAAENLQRSGLSESRIAELSGRIQARCAQVRELVDAMLSLARDPHSLENEFRELRLLEVVRDQVEASAPHVDSRGVKMTIIEEADPKVFASAPVLNVVIGNLLRNAVIHSNSSEVQVRVTGRGCSIRDFGQGISEEMKERIFDRYSSNGADPGRDFGIGLSLVRRLCTHFRWELTLESARGRGTTMSVDFGESSRLPSPR
jgi:signal transduction histidine kinase